jgi:hypothetical protein
MQVADGRRNLNSAIKNLSNRCRSMADAKAASGPVIIQEPIKGQIFVTTHEMWSAIGSLLFTHPDGRCPCGVPVATCLLMAKMYCGCRMVSANPKKAVVKFAKAVENPTLLLQYSLWTEFHRKGRSSHTGSMTPQVTDKSPKPEELNSVGAA